MFLFAMLTMSSCKDWLTVKPDDKIDEKELYSTPEGVLKALTGVYLGFCDNNSYAKEFSCATLDVLGQMYAINPIGLNTYRHQSAYKYTEKEVKTRFDDMWKKSYELIANINNILKNVEGNEAMFDPENLEVNYNYVIGECYALRAMLHFDIFRLWGPMYGPDSENALSLPYYKIVTNNGNPYLPSKEFLENVLSDLNRAEALLEGDLDLDKVLLKESLRNMRMNIFAVKGLIARVHLYMGDNEKAFSVASSMISSEGTYSQLVSMLFPFVTQSSVENIIPDRVFYSEILCCFNNSRRGALYDENFSYQLEEGRFLAPKEEVITKLFSINPQDYRNLQWKNNPGSSKEIEFLKFQNITDDNFPERTRVQSLIRLGELYLIAAETAPTDGLKYDYLDRLRVARGYQSGLSAEEKGDWTATLLDEYKRELYGEGQYFFALKRLKIESLNNGVNTSTSMAMGAAQYVVPIPDSEKKS